MTSPLEQLGSISEFQAINPKNAASDSMYTSNSAGYVKNPFCDYSIGVNEPQLDNKSFVSPSHAGFEAPLYQPQSDQSSHYGYADVNNHAYNYYNNQRSNGALDQEQYSHSTQPFTAYYQPADQSVDLYQQQRPQHIQFY